MDLKAFNAEITRLTIFWTAIEIAAFIVGMYVLYLVVKAAVRDGITESGLTRSWSRAVAQAEAKATDLPDMRADR